MKHTIVIEVHVPGLPDKKVFTEGDDFNDVLDVACNIADPKYNISHSSTQEDGSRITSFEGPRRNVYILSHGEKEE